MGRNYAHSTTNISLIFIDRKILPLTITWLCLFIFSRWNNKIERKCIVRSNKQASISKQMDSKTIALYMNETSLGTSQINK